MTKRNDQIFQLSLTEIAFTIVFVLLLLLGYLVIKEQTERVAAEAALAKVQSTEQAAAALELAKGQLKVTLGEAGAGNPDQIISKLIESDAIRAEREVLAKKVEDLDAKLTALTELQNLISKSPAPEKAEVVRSEIDSALALQRLVRKSLIEDSVETVESSQPPQVGTIQPSAIASAATIVSAKKSPTNAVVMERVKQSMVATSEFKKQLKEKLDRSIRGGEEVAAIRDVVSAAKSFGELGKGGLNPEVIKKENSDLRGQVAFLKNKLARGGLDYPPCWADENGKIDFLFLVELKPDSILVSPAWPSRRESDAKKLPGIEEVLAGGPMSSQKFIDRVQGIFNWSKSQNPECRHYVHLKSSINDAVISDRTRLMVENYFYKAEVRR